MLLLRQITFWNSRTFYVYLLIFLQGVFCLENSSCETGWIQYENKCYWIIHHKKNQSDSLSTCQDYDSTLASISNSKLYVFLRREVQKVDMDKFWVNLKVENNVLIWGDGVSGDQEWVFHLKSYNYHEKECYAFNGENIEEKFCWSEAGFICEQSLSKNSVEKCSERTISINHFGICVWISNGMMSRNEANYFCNEHGGQMINIHQLYVTYNVMKRTEDPYFKNKLWIRNNSSDPMQANQLQCIDMRNTEELRKEFCIGEAYVICRENSPEYHTRDGNRRDISDSSIQPESVISAECPHGYNWKEYNLTEKCYWETSYETAKLPWKKAREYCQSYGGDLASFHSQEEERIGLSFQYGSSIHPYWIGLHYDVDKENFVWADESTMDYQNWKSGQPDFRNLSLRCVQMDAKEKKWFVSYCGSLSWFICKAPKQIAPKQPIRPTLEPLQPCSEITSDGNFYPDGSYFFDGYCYEVITIQYDWHKANLHCQNKDAELVSVHSESEIDFLIILLYEEKALSGNRVWVGLNALGLDPHLKWSDRTLLDFVHWNNGEPNNFAGQEECVNMYVENGLWNDENCNQRMGFICKRKNGTTVEDDSKEPMPYVPRPGNCKTGWYTFDDYCYLPVGERKKEWADFENARESCILIGGELVSIGSEREQVFLTFLIQILKNDAWIGLHDIIKLGNYTWLDKSPSIYYNWAIGEPSIFGLAEECVFMLYSSSESGHWKDSTCYKKLPYICKARKNATITTPSIIYAMRCPHPEDWMKHGLSCFKFFNESKPWVEADDICTRHGAKLISVNDVAVQSTLRYLSLDKNVSTWIGLFVNSNLNFEWINGLPMKISQWDKNQPVTKGRTDLCFVSSSEGFWSTSSCEIPRPFICQISAEKPLPENTEPKSCPKKNFISFAEEDNYCYMVEENVEDIYHAYLGCYLNESNLFSIHSKTQVENIKKFLKTQHLSNLPFYIGLTRNKNEGFAWSDGTPVDFEYWDEDEPGDSNGHCVEMKTETLKWRVTTCLLKRNTLCSVEKETNKRSSNVITNSSGVLKLHQSLMKNDNSVNDSRSSLSNGAVAGILIAIIIIAMAILGAYFYLKPYRNRRLRINTSQVTSFENVLYDANVPLEIQEDEDNSSPVSA